LCEILRSDARQERKCQRKELSLYLTLYASGAELCSLYVDYRYKNSFKLPLFSLYFAVVETYSDNSAKLFSVKASRTHQASVVPHFGQHYSCILVELMPSSIGHCRRSRKENVQIVWIRNSSVAFIRQCQDFALTPIRPTWLYHVSGPQFSCNNPYNTLGIGQQLAGISILAPCAVAFERSVIKYASR
jgi:hypothetical protein